MPQPTQNTQRPIRENLHFIANWLAHPRRIGAIAPTGWPLAERMARHVNPGASGPVLELGPGTGVITRAILAAGLDPRKLISVEYSAQFADRLKQNFNDVTVLQGDAFDLDTILPAGQSEPFSAVISSLPLLNFAPHQRTALLMDMLERSQPDAPFVQFSYGAFSPIPKNPGLFTTQAHDWVLRNIPPARVWVYRRQRPD